MQVGGNVMKPGVLSPEESPRLTFAWEALDEAQESQQADLIAWVGEVGPGRVDVA